MYKKLLGLILLIGLSGAVFSLMADESDCEGDEVFKDNLCWFRADKKLNLAEATDYCNDEGGRLPTMAEARSLLEQYRGKKVRDLGKVFEVSGPFFFWVQQDPNSESVQIILPGTSATMSLDPTSKLYAQCVRSPGEKSSIFGF